MNNKDDLCEKSTSLIRIDDVIKNNDEKILKWKKSYSIHSRVVVFLNNIVD